MNQQEGAQRDLLPDFPRHLDIEASSRCNFNCTFCDKQPFLQKDQLGDMDLALFQKIIDEGTRYGLSSVQLSYRGEPLLHKDIAEMIRYAKQKGVQEVFFCTNGMLLTPQMTESLIEAGLDCITVSVQGADPESFELARLGAKFHNILRNIKLLMEMKAKKGIQYPYVKVQAVAIPELDPYQYRQFWEPFCDQVVIVEYKDAVNRQTGKKTAWICEQPWQRMTIEWDGTILACNNDDLRLTSPGNARTMSLYEAWHHKKVDRLRQMHLKGDSHKIDSCDGCPYRTNMIKKHDQEA